MIPAFETAPGEGGCLHLPPGVHTATWREIVARFGTNDTRSVILEGLRQALQALKQAGCRRVWIDGSFVTSKELPGDFDGCWDHSGVDFSLLDPVLLDFGGRREAQKAKFKGELFLAENPADGMGRLFLEFFQSDRDGHSKGIIQINLEDFT
ncbi:MAG: hypothetical protein ACI8TX_003880 [Hyphomicrobiaceae bacterium]